VLVGRDCKYQARKSRIRSWNWMGRSRASKAWMIRKEGRLLLEWARNGDADDVGFTPWVYLDVKRVSHRLVEATVVIEPSPLFNQQNSCKKEQAQRGPILERLNTESWPTDCPSRSIIKGRHEPSRVFEVSMLSLERADSQGNVDIYIHCSSPSIQWGSFKCHVACPQAPQILSLSTNCFLLSQNV
jgi:hypothetical protein